MGRSRNGNWLKIFHHMKFLSFTSIWKWRPQFHFWNWMWRKQLPNAKKKEMKVNSTETTFHLPVWETFLCTDSQSVTMQEKLVGYDFQSPSFQLKNGGIDRSLFNVMDFVDGVRLGRLYQRSLYYWTLLWSAGEARWQTNLMDMVFVWDQGNTFGPDGEFGGCSFYILALNFPISLHCRMLIKLTIFLWQNKTTLGSNPFICTILKLIKPNQIKWQKWDGQNLD